MVDAVTMYLQSTRLISSGTSSSPIGGTPAATPASSASAYDSPITTPPSTFAPYSSPRPDMRALLVPRPPYPRPHTRLIHQRTLTLAFEAV